MDKREYFDNPKTDRIKWIMHQRIRILIVDYSNLRWDKDFMSILKVLSEVLADEKEVRLLMNVTGCYVSGTVMFDSFKIIKPVRHHVVRRAIVGAAGYKLHFFFRPLQLLAKTRSCEMATRSTRSLDTINRKRYTAMNYG